MKNSKYFPFILYLYSVLLLTGLLSSCAHKGSGQYVFMTETDTVESLAKEFRTTVAEIRKLNADKKLVPGEWIFIPRSVGIIQIFDNGRDESGGIKYYSKNLLWPVPISYKISSYFGPRKGRHHDGIDIPAPRGSEIVASQSGEVIYSGNKIKGYGNLTIIDHGKGIYSVYAHAAKNLTKKGERVKKGEPIGLVGSTGRSSGPHLHFEIRYKNAAVDPMTMFQSTPDFKLARN